MEKITDEKLKEQFIKAANSIIPPTEAHENIEEAIMLFDSNVSHHSQNIEIDVESDSILSNEEPE